MFDNLKEVLKGKPVPRRKVIKAGGEAAVFVAGTTALAGCATPEEEKRDEFCKRAGVGMAAQATIAAEEKASKTTRAIKAETQEGEGTRIAGINARKTETAEDKRKSLEDELKEEMLGKYLPKNAKITLREEQQEYFSVGTMNHNVRSLPTTRKSCITHEPCEILGPYPCGEGHKINFGYVATIEWNREDGKGKHMERWGTQSLGSGRWLCIKQQEKMLNPPEPIVHFEIRK